MSQGPDRRRSPRVQLMGRLHGELIPADVPVNVREISVGGMSIETPHAFAVHSVLNFTLTLGDGAAVLVAGRVVYSRLLEGQDPQVHISGLEFVDADGEDATGVSGLVDKVR